MPKPESCPGTVQYTEYGPITRAGKFPILERAEFLKPPKRRRVVVDFPTLTVTPPFIRGSSTATGELDGLLAVRNSSMWDLVCPLFWHH